MRTGRELLSNQSYLPSSDLSELPDKDANYIRHSGDQDDLSSHELAETLPIPRGLSRESRPSSWYL